MIVSVHALFSTSPKIGARLISKGSAHLVPKGSVLPSHTAVLINERWVHESTGKTGVTIRSLDLWNLEHHEVARVKLADQVYQVVADKYREIQHKQYDYLGLFYIGLYIAASYFGVKIPVKNKWQSDNRYFCCEVLGKLTDQYYGMSAPAQILFQLQGVS